MRKGTKNPFVNRKKRHERLLFKRWGRAIDGAIGKPIYSFKKELLCFNLVKVEISLRNATKC